MPKFTDGLRTDTLTVTGNTLFVGIDSGILAVDDITATTLVQYNSVNIRGFTSFSSGVLTIATSGLYLINYQMVWQVDSAGERSAWVNQEIGYAKRADKLIVPVVEDGVDLKGFLTGLEYVTFRRESPEIAVSEVINYLVKVKATKEQQENLKAGLMVLFAVFAFAAISQK